MTIYKLHVIEHSGFSSFPGAFTKATVIYQDHVIIITVEIPGISCPSLYASRIPMKVKYQAAGFFPEKMKAIDAHSRRHVKIQFPERNVILELKIGMELFRFENKQVLEEIDRQ